MEIIKKRFDFVPNGIYSFNILFVQTLKSGISTIDVPESAIYNPESVPYSNKIIFDNNKSMQENLFIETVVNQVNNPSDMGNLNFSEQVDRFGIEEVKFGDI